MNWQEHIHRDPAVNGGRPIFRGTRLTVEMVLRHLGDGWTDAQLLENYPSLTKDHIRAAQAFGADAIGADDVIFIDRLAG